MPSHSTIWEDSAGKAHEIPSPPSDFNLLLSDLESWQTHRADFEQFLAQQRAVAAKVRIPTNTSSPKADRQAEQIAKRPHLKLAKKSFSFSAMADELSALNKSMAMADDASKARELFKSLDVAARNGQLTGLQGARVDALRHCYDHQLGLEQFFQRRPV